jgi:hypothetical protein
MRNETFHILSMHGKNAEFFQHFTSSLTISQNTQKKSVRMLRIRRIHTQFEYLLEFKDEMKTTLGGWLISSPDGFFWPKPVDHKYLMQVSL